MTVEGSNETPWQPVAKHMMKATEQALEKGFMPTGNFVTKNDVWELRCMECNSITITTYNKFLRKKNFSCVFCASNKFETDLIEYVANEDDAIVQVMLKSRLKPLEPYPGNSAKKWKCECLQCGETCYPRFYDISKRGKGGCKPCSNKPDPALVLKAIRIMNESGLEPLEPYKNASTPWLCRCMKCNEVVTPNYNNVRRGHGGCIYCQVAAFKPSQPAYLYFIHNKEFASYKIGIGNSNKPIDRLESHKKAGWITIKKYDFESGKKAISIEKKILKWIRKDLGIPVHLTNEQFSHGGATETFSDEFVSTLEVIKKIESLIDSYNT